MRWKDRKGGPQIAASTLDRLAACSQRALTTTRDDLGLARETEITGERNTGPKRQCNDSQLEQRGIKDGLVFAVLEARRMKYVGRDYGGQGVLEVESNDGQRRLCFLLSERVWLRPSPTNQGVSFGPRTESGHKLC